MNPCPCGYRGHKSSKCRCTQDAVARYQARISGPLLDRIDMQIEVAALEPMTLASAADGELSSVIAARVLRARQRQMDRQQVANNRMSTRDLDRYCKLGPKAECALRDTMLQLHWSARAYQRVLKVARTIADIENADTLSAEHVLEAIQHRRGVYSM